MQLDHLTPQECWQLSVSEREEYHRQQLLAQLAWVTREVPFYRRLELSLQDLRQLPLAEILAALPVVTKEMIRGRNPDFLAAAPLKGFWTKTGGSTGEPTEIFHDYLKVRRAKAAVAFARNWWGLRLGQKCFYVWGHSASLAPGWPGVKDRMLRPIKDLLRRRLRVNAYRMDQKSLGEYVRRLIRFQPRMIMGYTSSIYLIAQRFLDDGYDAGTLPRLRGVIVTADPCFPFQAELIRTAIGAPVIVEYGSVEVGGIAYDHPDGTLRVLEDRLIVETVPGADGLYDLVVTDLGSRGQPLIRFAMDDQCQKPLALPPHGEGFRGLGPIIGRVLDSVIGAGGRRLHGVALSHIVNASYPGVLRYRFHQQASGHLRVELQLKPKASKDPRGEAHLLAYLQNELGAGTPIELTYVETFPPTPSGKFRWVVSEMPQNQRIPAGGRQEK